ncbi:MAG: phage tail protein [Myxococcota bacterium]|nr:phage tail protein [Myxococcota bacterium]
MAAAEPPAQANQDPFRSFNYKVLVQNVLEGHFTECTGLGARVEAIPYREGGNLQVVHQLPGRVEYSEVTLRYGLTASRELFDWMMATTQGVVDRRNVSICIVDTDGVRELTRWNLFAAWPREWRGAPLDAMANQVAIETLVLVHEGLERDAGGAGE